MKESSVMDQHYLIVLKKYIFQMLLKKDTHSLDGTMEKPQRKIM